MKTYRINRADTQMPSLENRIFSPEELAGLEIADISAYPWDESGYTPKALASVTWSEAGLHVLLTAEEASIQAEETRVGGPVCRDSCLEFFLTPFPEIDSRYINIEVNPLGVMHLGLGEGRENRTVWSEIPEGFNISHSVHDGRWWAVSYTIPTAFVQAQFGRDLIQEQIMRGNFYTCDESIHPHFGAWQEISAARPDFHRPEQFGELVLT